jgi:hypothetical protein
MKPSFPGVLVVLAAGCVAVQAKDFSLRNSTLRVEIAQTGKDIRERVLIKDGGKWADALATGTATRVLAGNPGELQKCTVQSIERKSNPERIVVHSDCGKGSLERTLALSPEVDVVNVDVRFRPSENADIHSVEDRYDFLPAKHEVDNLQQGPLDFVWSQNLKNEPAGLMPHWTFKSPAVMFQQGRVFAALMPNLEQFRPPLSFDLDVTTDAKPWFSYGSVPSEPYGHSYFRRKSDDVLKAENGVIGYSYAIVASSQEPKLGYRRVVRRLWQTLGHKQLLESPDLQRNVRRPELALFDEWRQDAWFRYAGEIYHEVDCPGGGCGTLTSDRNYMGKWDQPVQDAWFNSWFQTLRSAYGWYLYGQRTSNKDIQQKAESVLSLALTSPQQEGAFSTIYLVPDKKWIREDGWAGFPEDYHTFCMSWTAYWMVKWAEDLTPQRKDQVLAFTRKYADFLLKQQLPSGVIPSWYNAELKPRQEFHDVNAETAGSAFFLLELGEFTGEQRYIAAATRAMEFITREVVPRQLWWDYETFKSCSRKKFDFYDRMTAQYPQNNLSTMQAAMAYMKLYRITKEQKWLETGTRVVDYLVLTQQVWNGPGLAPKLLGGFTTQDTDAEWSDARQCYGAVLLLDYYKETGELEYLERAVAAARSTFAVAPWENWAHFGYDNENGSMTGFHWGTGSAMTSVEIMAPMLGDAFINIDRKHGAGFNASSLRNVKVVNNAISFDVEAMPKMKQLSVRFSGVKPDVNYQLSVNGQPPVSMSGKALEREGYQISLSGSR